MSSNAPSSGCQCARLKKKNDEFEMEVQRIVKSIHNEMKEKYINVRDDVTVTTESIQTDSQPAAPPRRHHPTQNYCNYCRLNKYIKEAMKQNELPPTQPKILPIKCKICGKEAGNRTNYGVMSCRSCSYFFRANHNKKLTECAENCEISVETRNNCSFCRLKKCREMGMIIKNENARQQKTNDDETEQCCEVCEESTSGLYCGIMICRACQKFYRLHRRLDCTPKCSKLDGKCEINTSTRTNCRYCRFEKIKKLVSKPRTAQLKIYPNVCRVCGGGAGNVKNYGVITCEGCRKFFSDNSHRKWIGCGKNCEITFETRKNCRYCRLFKCREMGMMTKNDDLLPQAIDDSDVATDEENYDDVVSRSKNSLDPIDKPFGDGTSKTSETLPSEDVVLEDPHQTPIGHRKSDGSKNSRDGSEEDLFEPENPHQVGDDVEFRLEETLYDEADPSVLSPHDVTMPDPDKGDDVEFRSQEIPYDEVYSPAPSPRHGNISAEENTQNLTSTLQPTPCSYDRDHNLGSMENLDETNKPGCPPLVAAPQQVALSLTTNNFEEEYNNISRCSSVLTVISASTNIVHETENNMEKSLVNQNYMDESPSEVPTGNDSMRQEAQNMMIVNGVTDGYKSTCRFFKIKELRQTLTLKRLNFDTINDPEERKRQWIYFFFREYSQDLQNILSFLDNVPFLKILSRQEIVAQFKRNSFSIWTVWCLYGIENDRFILPNGGYMNREALRNMFRSKVLDRFFKISLDFCKLKLNPTEISLLILVLFSESLELNVSEHCWNMLEDLILKRRNGDKLLIELKKTVENLKELDGMISRSRRMTQMIDAIKCLN